MLPGLLLIVSSPSQGMVSEACCHISMGLLLPAGRAIAWQAQGWSRRGRRRDPALPCSGLRAFLGTLRPRPSTYCYDFFPIVGLLAMLFSRACTESLLPEPISAVFSERRLAL